MVHLFECLTLSFDSGGNLMVHEIETLNQALC